MKKPSISELKEILNNPKLMHWANELGLQGKKINEVRYSAMNLGTKKHSEIQNFINKGIELQDEERQQKLNVFLTGVEIMAIEESFENDNFKGRVDIIYRRNNIVYVGDFKPKFKRAYLEYYIQLICYKMHFGSDRICIIDTENFNENILSLDNEKLYEELIYNLINIYKIKQLI